MSSVNELLNYFVVNDDKDDVAKGGEGAKSRAEQLERERQKENEKAVVRRYFPGKKPHYAKNAKEEDDGEDDDEEEDTVHAGNDALTEYLQKQGHAQRSGHTDRDPGSDLPNARGHVDSRYERLKNKSIKGDERERITRRVREVKVINHPEEVKEEGTQKSQRGEEEEADNYEKYFPVGEEEQERDTEEEDEADAEDESSNSTDDQSDEESDDENYMNGEDGNAPMKHEYVFKTKRKTLLETQEKEKSENLLLKGEESEKKIIELEKKEKAIEETIYNDIMIEQMKNQKNNLFSSDENFDNDEDDQEEPNEEEYQLWKIRHLNRLKRDELDRKKHELVKDEISERRKMTDREIMEQNKFLPHKEKKKKKKMLFMQKYYHRGGFFQDLFEEGKEEIYTRDYNEPVYEDKVDKENLPKVLRVRRGNFGKQGQTKYTHLLDNDTSRKDSLWANRDMEDRRARRKEDLFERPTYRKG
ncbi:micro-fibrillar-associated protein, putative [Plasmodium knowlesi strain H]|uniref:Micro-fibrillar-associated protein, putative n=3 Tax=Plasmodium knowlesi TaxID=5850 RepID=A0A5K1VMU0_PLAKH|nr:microfibril-associated protein-like [Plasmodium knowlesi strain H]OTN65271.1 putative Micro-fibrillar-associated protein [Plasmodium knowlesi]CAA9989372.1 micro-fibrillar-associated protein, putative [Plasmodium knowlesi strain H]SBO24953.1 micro-fibrillar-associated protein, putative [Plasmodium knowlesi strain H]SBO27900.1 micro-fibrillar-associated protein, putative [Plasmodium knowlesi strain H]VVS78846.1 micro-fibrillar-associated protein, putative [Plasmodium knowlesi strain H]|eukprot:XP_002260099.1 microfibril-associated protein-like [Plasmodium knowlesi strain H]